FEVEESLVRTTDRPLSDPRALAVTATASGLEVLVTEAGSDTLFVFDFASLDSNGTLESVNLGPGFTELSGFTRTVESQATPLPSEHLVVVPTLQPNNLDSTLTQAAEGGSAEVSTTTTAAGEQAGKAAAGATLLGGPGSDRPGVAAISGDEQEATEQA